MGQPKPIDQVLREYARRSKTIATSHKRFDIRKRAEGRAEAYQVALRLLKAYRIV